MRKVLLLLMLLSGCDSVVKEEAVGPASRAEAKRSGTHFSYCFTCMPGMSFDGKLQQTCSFRASSFCPCTYKALVDTTPYKLTRESGKIEYTEKTQEVERLTPCN